MLTLGDLFLALTGIKPSGSESVARLLQEPIMRVAIDSRQVIPGSVFFALQGEALDGQQFIGEALARGAIAIVGTARARELGFGRTLTLIDVAGLQPNPSLDVTAESVPLLMTENSLVALQKFAGYWRRKFPKLTAV